MDQPLRRRAVASARPQSELVRRRVARSLIAHLLLLSVAVLFIMPFFWLIITSLKPLNQVFTDPITWLPNPVQWGNYREALTSPAFPFVRLLGNTLYYAMLATLGTVVSACVIAYAFARMEFRGRDVLFSLTLATMMLPSIVTLIPTYILFRRFGWIGTYAPLVVPLFFGSAFNIFLLRQFMLTIPHDLTDAARVDGANDWIILWRIIVPLVKPALLVIGLFQFLASWNDFFGPLIYLNDPKTFPLVLGLYAFKTRFGVQWHLMMAASLAVTAPIILLFFVLQRYFIEGVTLTGLRG